MAYVLHKLGAKGFQSDIDRLEQGRGFLWPPGAAAFAAGIAPRTAARSQPPVPAKSRRATLVDMGAHGGNAPDDILGG